MVEADLPEEEEMKRFLQVFLAIALLGIPALGFAAETKAEPKAPAAPAVAEVTDLSATGGNKAVTLKWTDPAGATAFKVAYTGSDGKPATVEAKPGDGANGVAVSGLNNGATVEFTVTTVAGTASSAGATVSATTFALDTGATAWMLTSAAIVLLMTVPGLALFYGGMVRRKNLLATMAYSYGAAIVVSIVWVVVQYSLAFSGNLDPIGFLGDFSKSFYNGVLYLVGGDTSNAKIPLWGATGVPESVFSMFQLMFAIITVALISGAIVERMAFGAWLLFSVLWSIVVYAPLAHMVWGGGILSDMNHGLASWLGFKNMNSLDFAGGLVVHISSGVSALVLALLLGPRVRYGKDSINPNNIAFTAIGAGLLWVGWFGFNAGSAVGSNGLAGSAFVVTNTAAAVAAVTWIIIEYIHHRKMTVVGISTGIVAGLVAITPASGFVDITGAFVIGVAVSIVCYLMVAFVKKALGYDDSLDAFGVHAIGGTVGALLTGVFALPAIGWYFDGATPAAGLLAGNPAQFVIQLVSVIIAWAWAIVGTLVCYGLVRLVTKTRVEPQEEVIGLDLTQHGEKLGDR
jgi:Amt family ammonium transporter